MPTKATSQSNTPSKRSANTKAGGAKPASASSEPEVKPTKPVKKKALSLIRGKESKKDKETGAETAPEESAKPTRKVVPPISKITAPGAAKPKPEPEPEPESEKPPEPEQVQEGEAGVAEGNVIHIKPPIVLRDLAALMDLKPYILIQELMQMEIFASINHTVEPDVAAKLCENHGFIFEVERREKGGGIHKEPEVKVEEPPEPEIVEETVVSSRPPIVTFMGHVDHGKTSLLDAIRKSRVTAGEAGGITQHIGAYSVDHGEERITFLDTPGHAAFTAMRARGANVTDIVVLVVAADDGLMPQTLEAISHAKAAKVPIIVAINKIDLTRANPDKVKAQLQEKELTPEEWGGDTLCCEVSATKGTGIDSLLETILLQAEVMELKSPPDVDARGTVVEAQLEAGRGPTATVIVKMGTLKAGQPFICGKYSGKVKSLINDQGKTVKEAGPSTPVKVLGFSGLPNAGDEIVTMPSEKAAKSLSQERLSDERQEKLAAPARPTLESFFQNLSEGSKKNLKLVLKADVQGSLEATLGALDDLPSDKVTLELIHSAVGPISESDILLASASEAIIIGFGVKVESKAVAVAKREGVQVKLYSIIYELIDQVKDAMAGLLDPELRETVLGQAEVRQVFKLTKGRVAGCFVTEGRIARTARARVLRGKQAVYDGGIGTLRRFQDDVNEVRSGLECGIKLGDYNEYEVGDIIECYQLEKVQQQL